MGLIIIIAVIAAVYFFVIKPKRQNNASTQCSSSPSASTNVASPQRTYNQPTRGVNLVPAAALINSTYYEKYKTVLTLFGMMVSSRNIK